MFLVQGGQRHLVPALTLPDEAIDAIPEGEPISADAFASTVFGAPVPVVTAINPTTPLSATPLPPVTVVVTATPGPAPTRTPLPTTVAFSTPVRSQGGGEPGATQGASFGPWEYVITGAERLTTLYGRQPMGRYIAIYATLTNLSKTAGVAGDGRYVKLADAQGRFYEPLYDALFDLRRPKGLLLPHEPVWPDQTFSTGWVYDIPPDASGLRLLLPLGVELDLGIG